MHLVLQYSSAMSLEPQRHDEHNVKCTKDRPNDLKWMFSEVCILQETICQPVDRDRIIENPIFLVQFRCAHGVVVVSLSAVVIEGSKNAHLYIDSSLRQLLAR